MPHGTCHVFDVYVRAGLRQDDRATIALETMDSCRISWGRVAGLEADQLVVERSPLVFGDAKLALGRPEPKRVTRQLDGLGFVEGVKEGDHVWVHWSWACQVLTPQALARLRRNTDC
jgi:hypothetical protein